MSQRILNRHADGGAVTHARGGKARANNAVVPPRPATSLFDRLIAAQEGQPLRTPNREAAIASIIRNLHLNLNGRAGGVETRPDWGLSDFHDLALGKARVAPRIAQEIKHQIETFEPRLRRVSVYHEPASERFMTASFRIHAELVCADERSPLTLETRIHANGSVRVR